MANPTLNKFALDATVHAIYDCIQSHLRRWPGEYTSVAMKVCKETGLALGDCRAAIDVLRADADPCPRIEEGVKRMTINITT